MTAHSHTFIYTCADDDTYQASCGSLGCKWESDPDLTKTDAREQWRQHANWYGRAGLGR